MSANEDDLTLARSLLVQGRNAEALALLDAAGGMEAGVAYCLAYGVVLRALGQPERAALAFQRVLREQPGNARALTYLGMIKLLQGRMAEGWAAYRARWNNPDWPSRMMFPCEHLWDGSPRADQRILIWSEQGFGDTIQFSRYIPWLAMKDVTLTFLCPAPLQSLFMANWKHLPIISAFDPGTHHFDTHLPLMDLPAVWQGPLSAVPVGVPYLGVDGAPPANARRSKVGIVWAGRPTHPEDNTRSIGVHYIESLIQQHPDIDWVGLQRDVEAPAILSGKMESFQDFLALARILIGLDLVITVDTAIAHLAGAMGKPVWVMLAHVPDWRWGMAGETSYWYPSVRLYRQPEPGDWDTVVTRLAYDLGSITNL